MLNLFLFNQDAALLENQVAIHLCRLYNKENLCFANNGDGEIDFIVEDYNLAIQVAYSLDDESTKERELKSLSKFQHSHPNWQCLIITNDTESDFEYDGTKICNFEMESSALAGLSALLGHKALTCCMVIANRWAKEMNTEYKNSIEDLIQKVLDRI